MSYRAQAIIDQLSQKDLVAKLQDENNELRAKVAELERMGSELSAGHCVHKRGIVAGEHGHALCPLAVDLGFRVPSQPHNEPAK